VGDPLVSVIIPAYNAADLLDEGIQSVRRQEHRPLEIIVVDDGSTDQTPAVARQAGPEVRYLAQANAGPGAARNRGIAAAAGELIGFLDDDDLWSADKLAVQVAMLRARPELDGVQGRLQRLVQVEGVNGVGQWAALGSPEWAVSLGSALFRRPLLDRVGRFDESLRFTDDFDWLLRAAELGARIARHAEVTQFHRRHAGNLTNGAAPRHVLTALKRSLDRRRAEGRSAELPAWFEAAR
jgi:glycosyltransferase involved in cell wall biosynthesis